MRKAYIPNGIVVSSYFDKGDCWECPFSVPHYVEFDIDPDYYVRCVLDIDPDECPVEIKVVEE